MNNGERFSRRKQRPFRGLILDLFARGRIWLLAGLIGLGAASDCRTAVAQTPDTEQPTSSEALLKLLTKPVAEVRQSTVEIYSDGRQVAMGLIVGADGWIVTKASELQTTVRVMLPDGTRKRAAVHAIDREFDVTLLKVDASGLNAVALAEVPEPAVGSWIITVGTEPEPLAVGVISNPGRRIGSSRGVLGISIDKAGQAVRVSRVYPNSSADRAGLKVGDLLTRIAGEEVEGRTTLSRILNGLRPGDGLWLDVTRGQEAMRIRATLGYPIDNVFSRVNLQNQMAGSLSDRRDGFPRVLIHDTRLAANMCGGAVVDIDGRLIGLNIARAARTDSYAIPLTELKKIVQQLRSAQD